MLKLVIFKFEGSENKDPQEAINYQKNEKIKSKCLTFFEKRGIINYSQVRERKEVTQTLNPHKYYNM